ncbi:MAG: 6-phosphogluconolactonase [Terriglobales bacterium]
MTAPPHAPVAGEWVIRATAGAASEEFCRRLDTRRDLRQAAGGPLTLALTGGHSAQVFYAAMAARFLAPSAAEPWRPEAFHFYWSDERLVPPDHPDSNYRLARDTLLAPARIPDSQIHRVPTEAADPPARYADLLRRQLSPGPAGVPRFDVLILGLGEDGHTASLFPHTDLWREDQRLVRHAAATPEHPHDRATFTPLLLNAAAEVWFVITGEAKADAVARLYARNSPPEETPALLVDPARTRVVYFVDGAAAQQLPATSRP